MEQKTVAEFIDETIEKMEESIACLQVLGMFFQEEKQKEKKPRKKVRQPPKYV